MLPDIGEVLAARFTLEREAFRSDESVTFEAIDGATTSGDEVLMEIVSLHADSELRSRFLRTAALVERLEGEHVLRVREAGLLPDGSPFVIRERPLSTLAAEVQARGTIQLAQAVAWTLEACEGVAEGHALGMSHGDVRPGNVYLARGATGDPTAKVGWTDAARPHAAREDIQEDIAGLGCLLRSLLTGKLHRDDAAPTLPSEVAHTVARAIAKGEHPFHDVAQFASELAPFAPLGHPSSRNVTFLLARAGMLEPPQPRESQPQVAAVMAPPPVVEHLDDDWFARVSRTSLFGLAPARSHRGLGFALVALLVAGVTLGSTVIMWKTGRLPQWTGTAPEDAGTTSLTSGEPEARTAATPSPAPPAPVTVMPSGQAPAPAGAVEPKRLPVQTAPPASAPSLDMSALRDAYAKPMVTPPPSGTAPIPTFNGPISPRPTSTNGVMAPRTVNAPTAAPPPVFPAGALDAGDAAPAAVPNAAEAGTTAPTTPPTATPTSLPPGVVAPSPSESPTTPSVPSQDENAPPPSDNIGAREDAAPRAPATGVPSD